MKNIKVQLFHLLKIDLFGLKEFSTIETCFSLTFLLRNRRTTLHILRQLTERGFLITEAQPMAVFDICIGQTVSVSSFNYLRRREGFFAEVG
jgi:hypothetical protein